MVSLGIERFLLGYPDQPKMQRKCGAPLTVVATHSSTDRVTM